MWKWPLDRTRLGIDFITNWLLWYKCEPAEWSDFCNPNRYTYQIDSVELACHISVKHFYNNFIQSFINECYASKFINRYGTPCLDTSLIAWSGYSKIESKTWYSLLSRSPQKTKSNESFSITMQNEKNRPNYDGRKIITNKNRFCSRFLFLILFSCSFSIHDF